MAEGSTSESLEEFTEKDSFQTDIVYADCPNGWRSLTYVQYPGKIEYKQRRAWLSGPLFLSIYELMRHLYVFEFVKTSTLVWS